MSQRARLMLELVLDVKNNRRRTAAAAAAEGALGPAAKAWLRGADLGAVQLQGISWELLTDPGKKVGCRSGLVTAPASRSAGAPCQSRALAAVQPVMLHCCACVCLVICPAT